MPRMRTISQAVKCLKAADPGCAVSEWWLRQLVKQNRIKHHVVGAGKYLLDLNVLEDFLKNPPAEPDPEENYGRIRKIT